MRGIHSPLAGALLLLASFPILAGDWSNWRGPLGTGVSTEKNLPSKWSPDPSKADNNLVWRAPYGGRTTPIVQQGRLYMIGRDGEGIS